MLGLVLLLSHHACCACLPQISRRELKSYRRKLLMLDIKVRRRDDGRGMVLVVPSHGCCVMMAMSLLLMMMRIMLRV
jgi:hypothetical protein